MARRVLSHGNPRMGPEVGHAQLHFILPRWKPSRLGGFRATRSEKIGYRGRCWGVYL
jgi:hypothetical protein